MKTKMRWMVRIAAAALCVGILTGCGGPKVDVKIFIMGESGTSLELARELEAGLQAKLGESPTFNIGSSPMFSPEKLMVEVAAGGNSLIIIPKEQFLAFGRQDAYISLDGIADPADYAEGVLVNTETNEEHLYAIPVHRLKWFTDAGYIGSEMYAAIPGNAEDVESAMLVLQAILEE